MKFLSLFSKIVFQFVHPDTGVRSHPVAKTRAEMMRFLERAIDRENELFEELGEDAFKEQYPNPVTHNLVLELVAPEDDQEQICQFPLAYPAHYIAMVNAHNEKSEEENQNHG